MPSLLVVFRPPLLAIFVRDSDPTGVFETCVQYGCSWLQFTCDGGPCVRPRPRILLKHVLKKLREERQRQELSLADITARSDIDRGTLSKLENDEDPNVTMNTLLRYAQAVGKVIVVQLEDSPA